MKLPHKIWKVNLDMLSVNSNEAMLSHEHIVMVILGEEEKEYYIEQKDTEDLVEKCALTLQISKSQYMKDSIDAFKFWTPPPRRQRRVSPTYLG